MKKIVAAVLAAMLAVGLTACGARGMNNESRKTALLPMDDPALKANITLWTYPVGTWAKESTVKDFIEKFNQKYPDIQVEVEYLDYISGDAQVAAAIKAGTLPDIILEGPERIISNWANQGKMVPVDDLWDEEAAEDIGATSPVIEQTCKGPDGTHYMYPLCMTTHCMAINYEVFEQADALQYLDLENRTWTTANFIKAMEAVRDSGLVQDTAIVYCGGQGGDQGTRALVQNLYSARFTDEEHTRYTINSEQGVKGLQTLLDMSKEGSISYDLNAQGTDELQMFANNVTAVSFCWNASNEAQYAQHVPFTPFAMTFPSEDGVPELSGGIWGFGIFDHKDENRATAAKAFVKFMCDDKNQGPSSVAATGFFPVRSSYGNVYANTMDEERMEIYAGFLPYLGDYYAVTPGWAVQRSQWWNMLHRMFSGVSPQQAADNYVKACESAEK